MLFGLIDFTLNFRVGRGNNAVGFGSGIFFSFFDNFTGAFLRLRNDVGRLDLIRSTALDRANATTLLRSANLEIVFAFLAAVLITVTGLALPIAYILNRRFSRSPSQSFLVVLRQAMWVGLWASFCTWLQMHRSLGLGVALLSAIVLVVVEMLLQVRTRAAAVSG